MVYLGLEPRVAGWKVQTNPLSYDGTPLYSKLFYFAADPVVPPLSTADLLALSILNGPFSSYLWFICAIFTQFL